MRTALALENEEEEGEKEAKGPPPARPPTPGLPLVPSGGEGGGKGRGPPGVVPSHWTDFPPPFPSGAEAGEGPPSPFVQEGEKGKFPSSFPASFGIVLIGAASLFLQHHLAAGGRALRLEGSLALPWEPHFRGESSREPLFLTQFTHFFSTFLFFRPRLHIW